MPRQFDSRNSFLNNKGNPLIGKVKFCRLHTSELENIYDVDGITLANPMYTNELGQLQNQVFLSDKDYTIYFYQYVGTSRMEDDDDPTNWLFIYSCDNLYQTFNIDVDSKNIQAVKNINALRLLDPNLVDGQMIELLGYNEEGDKPSVRYIWNQYSTESDNGGNIIKVNNISLGRWELVNDFNYITGVDVRHFGVFGSDTLASVDPTMPAKVDMANSYATSIGYPLYFDTNDGDLTWYKFNSNLNGALFANGTRIVATSDCTVNVVDENSYLDVYNDNNNTKVVTITGGVVKTSWGKNSAYCVYAPTLKLVIDSNIVSANRTFENLIVDCLYNVSDCYFTNCTLNSMGKLVLNNVFHSCVLKESMFATGFTAVVFDDDIIDIDDWPSTNIWMNLITQTTSKPLDFKGRTVDSNCYLNWNICKYINANFNNYTCTQNTIHFQDCTGLLILNENNTNLAIVDSTLSFSQAGDTITGLNIERSTVSFNKDTVFGYLYAKDSIFNDEGKQYHIATDDCYFERCTTKVNLLGNKVSLYNSEINGIVYCGEPTIIGCRISKPIQQTATTQNINFVINNNTWLQGSIHTLMGSIPDSIVVGSWIGNNNLCSYHFINLVRNMLNPSEIAHHYVYENNTGANTIQQTNIQWSDIIYFGLGWPTPAPKVVSRHQVGDITGNPIIYSYKGQIPNVVGSTTDTDYYLTEVQIFTVGTRDIGELSLTTLAPSKLTYSMAGGGITTIYPKPLEELRACTCSLDESERSYNAFYGAVPKDIVFMSGFTWRITNANSLFETAPIQYVTGESTTYTVPVKYVLNK